METELLASFLEVAQRLHFGHAAHHLRITQPALSHQIHRLERQVGADLFERTSRQVSLTAAGSAFAPQARALLAQLDRAVMQCRAIGVGGVGALRIGSIGAALNGISPDLVKDLREHLPGLAVQLTQMDTPAQVAALRAGEIDLGVVRSAGPTTGISIEDLFTEPMSLAVPATHRLAKRRVVLATELMDEAFILWPRATSPLFHDQIQAYCRSAGFVPRVVMEGTDIETQLGLVSAQIGVSPQPASFANLQRAGVVFRRLSDAPESTVQLAWVTSAPPAHLSDATRIAHQLAKSHRHIRLGSKPSRGAGLPGR